MKMKPLVLVLGLGMLSSVYADSKAALDYANRPNGKPAVKSATAKPMWPGFCEIEVVNRSSTSLSAWGRGSTGGVLRPTYIPYNSNLKIDLWDYNYGECPRGMDLNIETSYGDLVYSQFTYAETTVRISSEWGMLKAQVQKK
ncbi:MAG: hypothetical protein H0U57_09270 [Tatlockia sp.]|nr:hypothetical protein [Tatlockia sp.]